MRFKKPSRTIVIAFLTVVLASVFMFLKAGEFLVVHDPQPLQKADAIIVLGGDTGSRSLAALDLYKRGFAGYVLLTGIEDMEPAAVDYYLNWRAQIFLKSGVEKKTIMFDSRSRNTWEEANNTFKLMERLRWRHVIVVSDPPHMRRLKLVWDKVFKGSPLKYTLYPSRPEWWSADRWWKKENTVKFVFEEYLKLLYYSFVHY
jgi:uncharacterized SAM-binding protein YcdF (DUF218 family)